MNAEIIAVGSEMLTPEKIDTNSLYLTEQLNTLGVEVVQKSIVGDDRTRLAGEIAAALKRSDIVILSGGLGPTEDDVTRDASALALGRKQTFRQDICDEIAERFARMKRSMADNNKRQAYIIDGADVMPNDRGTAPGQWIEQDGRILFLLPGPPKELKAMFEQQCLQRLKERVPQLVIRTRHFRVAGMGESDLDQQIAPVYSRYTNPVTTILAGAGDIHIHLRARCETPEEAEKLLAEVAAPIEKILGDRIYSHAGESLEEVVGECLKSTGRTMSIAESCTGGMVAERVTSVPGSSNYFRGGFLTYTDEVKHQFLGVSLELLAKEGAVSEAVAREMAIGTRKALGTTFALSVTGFAGPDGGTEANPIGTVYIGLAYDGACDVKRIHFMGDRERIRMLASQSALDILRRKL